MAKPRWGKPFEIWRGVTTHINLNKNMRSSSQLARLLQQMRDGALTDDRWAALCTSLIQPTHSGEPPGPPTSSLHISACQCIVSQHAVCAPIWPRRKLYWQHRNSATLLRCPSTGYNCVAAACCSQATIGGTCAWCIDSGRIIFQEIDLSEICAAMLV